MQVCNPKSSLMLLSMVMLNLMLGRLHNFLKRYFYIENDFPKFRTWSFLVSRHWIFRNKTPPSPKSGNQLVNHHACCPAPIAIQLHQLEAHSQMTKLEQDFIEDMDINWKYTRTICHLQQGCYLPFLNWLSQKQTPSQNFACI